MRLTLPTRSLTMALLASASALGASTDDLSAEAIAVATGRLRPAAAASGPQGMPRVDPSVELVTFQAIGLTAPLRPEPVATFKPTPVEAESSAPQRTSVPPEAVPAPQLEESPASPEVSSTKRTASPGSLHLSSPESSPARQPSSRPTNPLQSLLSWRPSERTVVATCAGTAVVVGLLVSFVWLLRSLQPRSSRPLPREVVEVLGRAPLAGKQTTQLMRVGHKLLLVAITPDGAKTLTEIEDPDEVAQLVAACDSGRGRGSTAEFDALLRQMESERTSGGFLEPSRSRPRGGLGLEEPLFDPRTLAAAYANTPGGRGDV